jgi:hypothetical protein
MPKGVSGPTWALLPPNKLPDASEVEKILGAIIPDYENPLQNPIPEDASKVIPNTWFAKPTEDGNFKVLLDRARGDKAHTRLGDSLNTAFRRNISNNLHLTSMTVKTYAVKEEIKAFNLLKKMFKEDIVELIDRAPSRSNRSVFAIEAIKTCLDAKISSKATREDTKKGDPSAPVNETVTLTNFSHLVNHDAQLSEESIETTNTDESHTAKGERILAVQYRIIKKRSDWSKIWRPKPPLDFYLDDMYVPDGPSMYGSADEKDDGECSDLDDDDNGKDDNPIELGDIEHTWNLLSSADDTVVMTTL